VALSQVEDIDSAISACLKERYARMSTTPRTAIADLCRSVGSACCLLRSSPRPHYSLPHSLSLLGIRRSYLMDESAGPIERWSIILQAEDHSLRFDRHSSWQLRWRSFLFGPPNWTRAGKERLSGMMRELGGAWAQQQKRPPIAQWQKGEGRLIDASSGFSGSRSSRCMLQCGTMCTSSQLRTFNRVPPSLGSTAHPPGRLKQPKFAAKVVRPSNCRQTAK